MSRGWKEDDLPGLAIGGAQLYWGRWTRLDQVPPFRGCTGLTGLACMVTTELVATNSEALRTTVGGVPQAGGKEEMVGGVDGVRGDKRSKIKLGGCRFT